MFTSNMERAECRKICFHFQCTRSFGSWRFPLLLKRRANIDSTHSAPHRPPIVSDSAPNGGSHLVTFSRKRTRGTQQLCIKFTAYDDIKNVPTSNHKHLLGKTKASPTPLAERLFLLISTSLSQIVLDIFWTDLDNFSACAASKKQPRQVK